MTRLIFYIVFSLAITLGAAWLIGLEGTLTIDFAGYRMQPALGATALALIALILVSILIWAIIRRIIEAPKKLAKATTQRRKDLGVEALTDGFIALQAGDAAKARKLAREARSRLPKNAGAQLLEARSDLALGDLGNAREHYRALISNPDTSLAALFGLYEQANAQSRKDVAITFAQKAYQLSPASSWAQEAVFDDLTKRQEWAKALEMITSQPVPNRKTKEKKNRRQTVLHTAIAKSAEITKTDSALANAQAALKLQPDFVPAALIAARIYSSRNEIRKSTSLLRRVWRATGHPHIAELYFNAQPGASAIERLKKADELIGDHPENSETAIALARAAIDAYEWTRARNILAPFLGKDPSQSICVAMAEIEEGQSGDQGKTREWLSRAVNARRDPSWLADGISSDVWEPTSPLTGKLDAFTWRAPTTALATSSAAPDDKENIKEPEIKALEKPEQKSEKSLIPLN